MGSEARALAEFDAAYPRLVTEAFRGAQRFFRYYKSRVDDAVAETMARTYERWEKVRRHDNPSGWVVICAKNVCLEQLRADARQGRAAPSVHDGQPLRSDHAEQTAVASTIWKALDQLSKRQRDVAVLRYLMDLDEAATAQALGTTISKVKTAAHEARGRLRTLLAETYGKPGLVEP
jgi:RNA polymerase sigma factor (sigma-70 family)